MVDERAVRDVVFLRAQQVLLECLFPSGWLEKARAEAHPAAARWHLLQGIIERRGILLFPEQDKDLPLLSRTILDGALIAQATDGNVANLVAGPLAIMEMSTSRRRFVHV